jgi:hypothetical protein
MQDNASIHNAKATITLFQSIEIDLMQWPANSPDLNPIENVWSILKDRIGRHCPTTRKEAIQAIQIEWSCLTSADISRCCQSMRERCQAVIDAQGAGWTVDGHWTVVHRPDAKTGRTDSFFILSGRTSYYCCPSGHNIYTDLSI